MENTLRIREVTRNKQRASYANVELMSLLNAARVTVHPAIVQYNDVNSNVVNITFVPATPHNIALFLTHRNVEVARWGKKGWELIPKDWLEEATRPVAPLKDEVPSKPKKETSLSVPSSEQKQKRIKDINDFLEVSKNQQMTVLQSLIRSESCEMEFKKTLVTAISVSKSEKLANPVKESAKKYIDNLKE